MQLARHIAMVCVGRWMFLAAVVALGAGCLHDQSPRAAQERAAVRLAPARLEPVTTPPRETTPWKIRAWVSDGYRRTVPHWRERI